MKRLFYLIVLLSSISCNNKKNNPNNIQSTKNEVKSQDVPMGSQRITPEEQIFFYKTVKIDFFDFNQFPLSKDTDEISNKNTDKYTLDRMIKETILEKENYYKLINYSKVNSNEKFILFTVFGNYDYYTNILLISKNIETDSLIDYEIIASMMGDADNTTEISSRFLNSNTVEITTKHKKLTKEGDFELLELKKEILKIQTNGEMQKE